MKYSTLFFDLDDTLYSSENGLWNAIKERMNIYMRDRLKKPAEEISRLRKHYFETYGTTLKGLQIHYQVDPTEFLGFVHDLPLEVYLQPDPHLFQLLKSLPQRKWIFTNADAAHASRVLERLGLSVCFDGIIDVCALDYQCKPGISAYRKALEISGGAAPSHCVFFDDSPRNLDPARELGFFTVLVGTHRPDPSACLSIQSLHEIPDRMPELY
jgi:putative hydrolase of the HAD superfamily